MSKFKDLHKKIVKWGSYAFFVVLALLLILTFGVPSITQDTNKDKMNLAVVNGRSVTQYDFMQFLSMDNRFAERIDEITADENMRNYVLSLYIQRIMNIQYAEKIGIRAPRKKVIEYIRSIPFFRAEEDDTFSSERMESYLNHFNMSFDQFYDKTREVVLLSELNSLIVHGAGVSPDEIQLDKTVDSSEIQIAYAFLPNSEIKNRYPDEVTVTEAEIDEALQERDTEDDDNPNKTRASVQSKLESKKIDVVKHRIADKLEGNDTFEDAVAALDVEVMQSKPFAIGNPVYADNQEKTMLYELSSDPSFYSDCLNISADVLADPVIAGNGVYAYTVTEKQIEVASRDDITDADESRVLNKSFEATQDLLLDSFYENSKVVRNYQK